MRSIYINGILADIDDNTAVGITYQALDFKQPGKRKVKVSNTFSIPATANNLSIIKNENNPQSTTKTIYDKLTLDYYQDNEKLIDNSFVRIEGVADRIDLFVYEKPSFWDQMKTISFDDAMQEMWQWMSDNNLIYNDANPAGTFNVFVSTLMQSTEYIVLPRYAGNLYQYDPGSGLVENFNKMALNYNDARSQGGHFCVYWKSIFKFIEFKYSVTLFTDDEWDVVGGNIFSDTVFQRMIEPVRYLIVDSDIVAPSTLGDYRFKYKTFVPAGDVPEFPPHEDVIPESGKTLYDLINGIFQEFNIVIDSLRIQNQANEWVEGLVLRRFDDVRTDGDVVNWSGKIDSKTTPKFRPRIDGYSQNSYIKYKEVFPNGGEFENARLLTSQNKNLDATNDLFEIDAYVPSVRVSGPRTLVNISDSEAFKTFPYLYVDATVLADEFVDVEYTNLGLTVTANEKVPFAEIYSINGEYQLLDTLLDYPVFYESSLWLTMSDLKDLKFFRQYFIQELGGSFFINKISGFNPEKSFASTKVELVKVSNDTPYLNGDTNYWVDGVNDPWTDGVGDVFV